jgi:hypothetical protein
VSIDYFGLEVSVPELAQVIGLAASISSLHMIPNDSVGSSSQLQRRRIGEAA